MWTCSGTILGKMKLLQPVKRKKIRKNIKTKKLKINVVATSIGVRNLVEKGTEKIKNKSRKEIMPKRGNHRKIEKIRNK